MRAQARDSLNLFNPLFTISANLSTPSSTPSKSLTAKLFLTLVKAGTGVIGPGNFVPTEMLVFGKI